jgi:heterodisulfide reductase subunit A-like polyferredoxin
METVRPGVFLAGTGAGPMDIPEAVAHASGAAAQVLKLFSRWRRDGQEDDLCLSHSKGFVKRRSNPPRR